jgi:hypothetical protein
LAVRPTTRGSVVLHYTAFCVMFKVHPFSPSMMAPVVPALGRLRQKDGELRASTGYTVRP